MTAVKSSFWAGVRVVCVVCVGALLVLPAPLAAADAAVDATVGLTDKDVAERAEDAAQAKIYGEIAGLWDGINRALVALAEAEGGRAVWVDQVRAETAMVTTALRPTDIVWLMGHYRTLLNDGLAREGIDAIAGSVDRKRVVDAGVVGMESVLLRDSQRLLAATVDFAEQRNAPVLAAPSLAGSAQEASDAATWQEAHHGVAKAARRLAVLLHHLDRGPILGPREGLGSIGGVDRSRPGHPFGPHGITVPAT